LLHASQTIACITTGSNKQQQQMADNLNAAAQRNILIHEWRKSIEVYHS
jgi:hypothetical protein